MPVLQSVARLEFRLQSTDPNDPSQLPSDHGEELVLQPDLSAVVAYPWADLN